MDWIGRRGADPALQSRASATQLAGICLGHVRSGTCGLYNFGEGCGE